jgi:flagellin
MSSILTNNSAMVALQTLKSINKGLQATQNEISTGKSIASAADNSAVWAISKVMESDVQGFEAISSSLALGESTVAVARQASETVTDLLQDMKDKIVSAQSDNVDRGKIQEDVVALREQIKSVVGAAQFNGLNLVDGSSADFNTNGNLGANILSSLDRDASGGVTASNIGVDAQNLSTTAGTALTTAAANIGAVTQIDADDGATGGTDEFTFTVSQFLEAGNTSAGSVALKASTPTVNLATDTGFVEGDIVRLKIGNIEGSYTIKAGDDEHGVATGLRNGLAQAGLSETDFSVTLGDPSTAAGTFVVQNNTNFDAIAVELTMERGTGALAQLETMDVSTAAGAETALGNIEGMIQSAVDASASFGSVEGRVETQSTFVSNLTDSLKSGIGSLVDANMEEASARLQALQTQQQLGVQALSIANQAPQSILQLFR